MSRSTALVIFAVLFGVLAMLLWQRLSPTLQAVTDGEVGAQEQPADGTTPASPIRAAASTEGASPPHLEGSAEVTRRRLRGSVTLKEGASPLAVFVYLLPKGVAGAEKVEHVAQPDEEGIFDLGELDPTGHWIAAWAQEVEPELAPVFVDGDTWDGRDLTLHIRPGRILRVRVSAEAGTPPPARVEAVVTPLRSGPRWVFPGPQAQPEFAVKKDVSGSEEVEFRLPTSEKVRVRIDVPDHHTDPAEIVLGPQERLAAFKLYGVGALKVKAIDAETGASLGTRATVVVLSLATGQEVVAERAALLPRWMREHGLRPGHYALLVRAPGYVPASVPDVEVKGAGLEAEATVALSLDPGAGMAQLKLLFADGESLGEKHVHVEGRRRSAPTPEARAWQRWRPRSVDAGSGTVTVGPLDLGDWEFVVWAGSARVGRTEVAVNGGFPDSADVRLVEGLSVDLSRVLPDPTADDDDVFVELRRPDGEVWPPVRFESRQRRIGLGGPGVTSERVERGGVVEANAVLGPYPSDELELYVRSGDVWKPAGTIRAE